MSDTDISRQPNDWASHPVDLRLSLPLPGRRIYLTVVAGRERRHPERRRKDLHRRPRTKLGNVLFLLGIAGFFYAAAIIGLFFYGAVVAF